MNSSLIMWSPSCSHIPHYMPHLGCLDVSILIYTQGQQNLLMIFPVQLRGVITFCDNHHMVKVVNITSFILSLGEVVKLQTTRWVYTLREDQCARRTEYLTCGLECLHVPGSRMIVMKTGHRWSHNITLNTECWRLNWMLNADKTGCKVEYWRLN